MSQATSKKPSAIAQKSAARLVAVQLIYSQFFSKLEAQQLLKDYQNSKIKLPLDEGEELITPNQTFLNRIVSGVLAQKDMFEEMLAGKLSQKQKKTDILIKSILLCGVYELFTENEIDTGIIISDYLHVTEAFFEGGETKIVHGILDSLAKDIRN